MKLSVFYKVKKCILSPLGGVLFHFFSPLSVKTVIELSELLFYRLNWALLRLVHPVICKCVTNLMHPEDA